MLLKGKFLKLKANSHNPKAISSKLINETKPRYNNKQLH